MSTFYDEIGGYETIRRIVARFYEGVATDPVLRPLYPEADLGPAEERFRNFLVQYWGGPTTYSDQRGHPRHVAGGVAGTGQRHQLALVAGQPVGQAAVFPVADRHDSFTWRGDADPRSRHGETGRLPGQGQRRHRQHVRLPP